MTQTTKNIDAAKEALNEAVDEIDALASESDNTASEIAASQVTTAAAALVIAEVTSDVEEVREDLHEVETHTQSLEEQVSWLTEQVKILTETADRVLSSSQVTQEIAIAAVEQSQTALSEVHNLEVAEASIQNPSSEILDPQSTQTPPTGETQTEALPASEAVNPEAAEVGPPILEALNQPLPRVILL